MEKKEREKEVMQIVTMIKDNLFKDWKADVSPLLEFIEQELAKAREEGKREQAELDRALYSVSFEHIKNADFEKILLESVDKAREEQFTQKELKRIEELLGFMLSDYPSSFWKLEDKSIEKKLSKLKQ